MRRHYFRFAGAIVALGQLALPATPAMALDSFAMPADEPRRPLRITVSTGLEFAPVATGPAGGNANLDPQSGEQRASGDVITLGGYAFRGEVNIEGEPGQSIRIDMPRTIELSSPEGDTARVVDIATTLGPAPRLGIDGRLVFKFGGRLEVDGGLDGNFRGRVPITAEYQ